MILFRISKSQLQLLGAASLFLASKFKAIDHISSEKLVMYTDFSITAQELKVSNSFCKNVQISSFCPVCLTFDNEC